MYYLFCYEIHIRKWASFLTYDVMHMHTLIMKALKMKPRINVNCKNTVTIKQYTRNQWKRMHLRLLSEY